jgi:ERCC4-related helicase
VRWQHIQAVPSNVVTNSAKRVWFLAPTGALCQQQFKFFQSHLPGYNISILGGEEAERWSDQSTWDAILSNARVVVSTHRVLLDALDHAFVKIQELSLLIFDEGDKSIPIEIEKR